MDTGITGITELAVKNDLTNRLPCWQTIADNLRKAGWTSGCISSTDHKGRQFWVVAAERSDAGRFIVHADQELPAFLELESTIRTDRHNHQCDCSEPDEELGNHR